MTEWDFDRLTALMTHATPPGRIRTAADVLSVAAVWPHKFVPTLLSARAQMSILDTDQAALLESHRRRIERCDLMQRSICSAHQGVWALKGLATRLVYPAHLVRQQEDLDLAVDDAETVWRVGRSLSSAGWTVDAVWIRRSARRPGPEISVVFTKGCGGPTDDRIEVTTDPLEGDHWAVGSRPLDLTGTDSVSLALLLLVEEGVGRPFGARDLLDATLLLGRLADRDDEAAAVALVGRHGLAREWRRLTAALRSNPAVPRHRSLSVACVDATGARPPLRSWRRPLQWTALCAARRMREGTAPVANWLLTRCQSVVGARRLYDAGVALFGAALAADRIVPEPVRFDGPCGLLCGPLGSFALSAGADVPSRWLDRIPGTWTA